MDVEQPRSLSLISILGIHQNHCKCIWRNVVLTAPSLNKSRILKKKTFSKSRKNSGIIPLNLNTCRRFIRQIPTRWRKLPTCAFTLAWNILSFDVWTVWQPSRRHSFLFSMRGWAGPSSPQIIRTIDVNLTPSLHRECKTKTRSNLLLFPSFVLFLSTTTIPFNIYLTPRRKPWLLQLLMKEGVWRAGPTGSRRTIGVLSFFAPWSVLPQSRTVTMVPISLLCLRHQSLVSTF